MFDSIRRHQKWLWAVITTLTIVSFVAFFSPRSQRGSGRGMTGLHADTVGVINGRPVTREEYLDAYREAQLRYRVSTGEWPRNDEMTRQFGLMERETKNRLLLVEKLNEWNVEVTEKAVAGWIAEVFQDRERHLFQKAAYDEFIKRVLPEAHLTPQDFERFVRHEVGIQHLVALTGISGSLVTPQEAEMLFRRANEQADTEAVFLATTNYLTHVTVDPAALATYYTNHQAEYRLPERVQVRYVKFDATNHLAEAEQKMAQNTNLNQYIDAVYQQRGTNSFLDALNKPLTPEAAKAKIRSEAQHEYALIEAQKKAIDFANKLLEMPASATNLAKLAAEQKVSVHLSDPFDEGAGPRNLGAPPAFAKAAFMLTPQDPRSEQPIVGEDSVFLIELNQKIPSQIPPLESIREKVTEDFRNNRATEMVQSAGNQLYNTITNSLAHNQTLQAAAGTNAIWIDLPPFSQTTFFLPELQGRADLTSLKNAVFALSVGNASSFTPTREGGFIVRLQAKLPVDDAKVKAELPKYLADLRQTRKLQAFSEWLRNETELAHITLPGDKQTARE